MRLSSNALTTVAEAREFLGIASDDDSQDLALIRYINSASAMIASHCKRVFELKDYVEFKQGRNSSRLILDNYPIVRLTNVTANDETLNLQHIRVLADNGMLYRPTGTFPSAVRGGRLLYPKPDEYDYNILVEYQAGYVLPKDESDENPRNLPFDIEMACLRMLRVMKKDKEVAEGKNLILKREQIGDWIGEYEPENKGVTKNLDYMPSDVLALLEPYRRAEFDV